MVQFWLTTLRKQAGDRKVREEKLLQPKGGGEGEVKWKKLPTEEVVSFRRKP
jgi:hypothetical protein